MAYAEYYVVCSQTQNQAKTAPQPKWNGAASESEVTSIKTAKLITVTAESSLEAIKGVKESYPGWITTKVIGIEKAAVEEV